MRIFAIAGLALFLASCVSTESVENRSAASEPDLPAITLFRSDLSDALRQDCSAYRSQSMLHYCEENHYDINTLANTLKDTGRFERVSYGRAPVDYQVFISSTTKHQDDAKRFANAVVSGASLMLIPMQMEMVLNTEFTILWRGEKVDSFSLEFQASQPISILQKPEHKVDFFARLLADRLMEVIDEHDPFTADRLARALQSSDYTQMEIPEALSDYRQIARFQYHDPLLGTMVSYHHSQFAFDRVDVFVYPIRAIDWADPQKVIALEMENVRSEILHLEREGHIDAVEMSAAGTTQWRTGQTGTAIGFMEGHYSNGQGERFYTATYVFIMEDKFVKVRASFPINDEGADIQPPHGFARALLDSLSVPQESLFMSRIRQAHRNSSMNE